MSPAKFNIIFFKQPNDYFFKRVVLVCSGLLLKLLGISFTEVIHVEYGQGIIQARLTRSDYIRI